MGKLWDHPYFPPWTRWVHPRLAFLVQVGCVQPHSALEEAATVSASAAWWGLGADRLAGSRHGSCGHRCLPCSPQCGSCYLQDAELHAAAVPSFAGVLSS